MGADLKKVNSSIMEIVNLFGDNCKPADFGEEEGELSKTFFSLITSFGRAFQAAIIDNTFQRTADASKPVEEKKESKSKTDGAKIATSGNKEGDSKPARRDNIFGNFQKSQGADVSANVLISEFKTRLM